jgi:ATP-dependent DNA ligase
VDAGRTVCARACRLGTEVIVSEQVDAPYRSGPQPAWVKVRNPASVVVQHAARATIRREADQHAGMGRGCDGAHDDVVEG